MIQLVLNVVPRFAKETFEKHSKEVFRSEMYPENKSDKADNAITDQRLIIVLSSVSRIVEAINLKKG